MTSDITIMVAFVRRITFDMKVDVSAGFARPSIESINVRVYEEPPDKSYDYYVTDQGITRMPKANGSNLVLLRHIALCEQLWKKTVETVMPPPVIKKRIDTNEDQT